MLGEIAIPPRSFLGKHTHHIVQMRFAFCAALLRGAGKHALIVGTHLGWRHDFVTHVVFDTIKHDQRSLTRYQLEALAKTL